jgi:Protein of unknown function (DUF3551)
MRIVILVLFTASVFGIALPALAQTGIQYPFCIQGIDNPGYSGCSFNSFQECLASASGTDAECISNPWYKTADSAVSAQTGIVPFAPNIPIPVGPPPFAPGAGPR